MMKFRIIVCVLKKDYKEVESLMLYENNIDVLAAELLEKKFVQVSEKCHLVRVGTKEECRRKSWSPDAIWH